VKIVLTGATGFIGRHVAAECAGRGLAPTIVCRPGTTVPPELPASAIVECDIAAPPDDLYQALDRPDVVIHLAWDGLPDYKSLRHIEEELPAQYRFLKRLIVSGVRHCVVAGTCLEYGLQCGELSEECAARPITAYGFAKDSLRRQLQFLHTYHRFSLTWARLFYTYGAGQPKTSLYTQLRAAALRGDTHFPMSAGEQLRDYLPVEDVARAVVALALRSDGADIVNVCAGRAVSVRRLVEQWIEANGWAITPDLGCYPYPDYEPLAFWGARGKLDSLLERP